MMSRLVGVAAGLVLVVGLVLLRSTTMTRHTAMPPDSRLTVVAWARWRETDTGAQDLARAVSVECVVQTSETATTRGFEWRHSGRFRFSVVPALDHPDRRQLTGCLSDLRLGGFLVDVESVTVSHGGVK